VLWPETAGDHWTVIPAPDSSDEDDDELDDDELDEVLEEAAGEAPPALTGV